MIDGQELPGAECAPDTWNANHARTKQVVDLFYADEKEDPEAVAQALAICSNCPVRTQCLDMHMSERYGVWGGKTEQQRKDMRRIVRMT